MIKISDGVRKTLKDIGLDRAETQVVFYLFKHGLSKIADITAGVSLPRSSVHLAVENLITKNVLATTLLGKRRMIYVEKPEKIRKFVEHEQVVAAQKMAELENIMPELRTFFAVRGDVERIDVEHLEGEDGFVDMFYRSLDQKRGGEVLRMQGDTEKFTVARDRLKGYGVSRRKKGIHSRNIIVDSPKAQDEIEESKIKMRETRVVPKSVLDPRVHFVVWGNCIAFTIWDQGLHTIIITNKSIAHFMRMMYEVVWKLADTKSND